MGRTCSGWSRPALFQSERETSMKNILAMGKGAFKVESGHHATAGHREKARRATTPLNHIGLWIDDLPEPWNGSPPRACALPQVASARAAADYDITFCTPRATAEFPIAGEGVLIELVQAPADVIAALG